jgi:hypothetical protein
MKFLKKIMIILGIIGALLVAEGLNRVGGLVSAFGGGDAPFYQGALIISVLAAGMFLLALFNKSNSIIKWIVFSLLICCLGLMLNAPGFPVITQIIGGLVFSIIACFFIKRTDEKSLANKNHEEMTG